MMDKQKTIKGRIYFEGTGLHSGQYAKVELVPAAINTGIIFVRQDAGCTFIKADIYSVMAPENFPRRTSIGAGGVCVYTIEHLMAAFHILGVDNIQVNIWGEEVPGLDGSAKQFVENIQKVGLEEQDAAVNFLTVREPLWVEEDSANIIVMPSAQLRVSYALMYNNPLIGSGYIDILLDGKLKDDIFTARTFCL
jgi:UDP-3-O-acyl-N-acetylglucosamine deacetylase